MQCGHVQLVEYFIPVLFICKFHKDWIKITQATQSQIWIFWHSRASNSKVTGWSCRNSNTSVILCLSRLSANFIKFQLKVSRLYTGQGGIWVFFCTKGLVTQINSSIWPEFELIRDFMHAHVICKFHKDLSKIKMLCSGQGQIWYFLSLKGE